MVNKKLIVISYCCIFLFIYFSAMAYAIIPTYLNKAYHSNIQLPKSQIINNTTTAVASINTSTLLWLVVIVIIGIIVFFIFGSISMFSAF